MTEDTPPVEAAADTTTPMRLRTEPPRVTRLSRKMLAGVGAVALLGIGGALTRTAAYAVSVLPAGVGLLGLLVGSHRPLHDRLAGTDVVSNL